MVADYPITGGTDGGEELDWDGIQVDTSTNIWIDHCKSIIMPSLHHRPFPLTTPLGIFETIGDGGIDLRKNTDFFTVSNTWLKGVNKAFGIGWTDNVTNSGTIHHTYFDGTTQRNPSADNLLHAHLYNNYLRGCKSYGHYARGATGARVENVYFEDCKNPLQADEGATLTAVGNMFDGSTGTVAKDQGKSFDPAGFYEYKLDAADDVPAIVLQNAGPRDGICQ